MLVSEYQGGPAHFIGPDPSFKYSQRYDIARASDSNLSSNYFTVATEGIGRPSTGSWSKFRHRPT